MSNTLDFTPSFEKIKRAEAKLSVVKNTIVTYVADNPYEVRTELHNGMCHIIASRVKSIPQDIAWEIVEAVGHLRSALDKMMIAIVEFNGIGVSGVSFPFGGMSEGKPESFPSKRTRDSLGKKLTPEQLKLVLAQDPYPTGNDLLWAINEIANEDKHRKDLVSAIPKIRDRSITMTGGISVIRSGMKYGAVFETQEFDHLLNNPETDRILLSYANGPIKPEVKCIVNIGIVFQSALSVQGREVTATLGEQIILTKNIVELFEKTFG